MASENKGILFCSVLKGDKVLSHYSSVDGNFIEFSRKVLEKSDNTSRDKATYTSGSYMLHYMRDGAIIYLCITDDEFERSKAFLFLSDIRRRFVLHRRPSRTPEDVNFESTISEQMEYYSRRFLPQLESINTYRNQLDELEEIEVHDIGSLAGDRVRLLPFTSAFDIDDCDSMAGSGTYFYKPTLCKPNWHAILCGSVTVVVLVVIVFFILVGVCGGFNFKKCSR